MVILSSPFSNSLKRGRLSGGCGLRWAGTRIDKWESSCRRTTRIIPTLRLRGSTISFHPWNAFHTGCTGYSRAGRVGRSGLEMETEIDRHSFGHLHHSSLASILNLILSKVSITNMIFYYSSKLFGILTLWWWEGWFDKVGYWTGFWDNYLPVKDPHPKAPSYHQSFFSPSLQYFTRTITCTPLNSSPHHTCLPHHNAT